jgi:hypothetical protein
MTCHGTYDMAHMTVVMGEGERRGPERDMTSGSYGKGYPRTDQSFTRVRHAQPFYALRVGYPQNDRFGMWLSSTLLDILCCTGLHDMTHIRRLLWSNRE